MIGGYTGDCKVDDIKDFLNDMHCCNIRINKERMDKALAADAVKMPKGLTKEQKREFIIERAKACQARNQAMI